MFQQKLPPSPSIEALNYFSELHPFVVTPRCSVRSKARKARSPEVIGPALQSLTQEPGSKSPDYADYSHQQLGRRRTWTHRRKESRAVSVRGRGGRRVPSGQSQSRLQADAHQHLFRLDFAPRRTTRSRFQCETRFAGGRRPPPRRILPVANPVAAHYIPRAGLLSASGANSPGPYRS